MEAKVIHMDDFRRKRAARLERAPVVAWDPHRRIAYHIECWLLAEGLTQ